MILALERQKSLRLTRRRGEIRGPVRIAKFPAVPIDQKFERVRRLDVTRIARGAEHRLAIGADIQRLDRVGLIGLHLAMVKSKKANTADKAAGRPNFCR